MYEDNLYVITINPRISPLGAYLLLIFLDGGLFERGAYKIIVDIKKTLLKDLVYFSRNFFMSILLITTTNMNLLW